MRRILPPFLSGLLVAAALYGVLAAVDRELPAPEDPWLEAWLQAGLKAQFTVESREPEKHLMFGDARPRCRGAAFEGTQLRRYQIQDVDAQVVRLPRADLLPEFPEGRHPAFRLKEKGSSAHLCRVGRSVLLLSTRGKEILLVGAPSTPKALMEHAFDLFEEIARRYP